MRLRIAAPLVLLAALAAGCATAYREDEVENRLERVGAATRGLRRPRAFAIHADSSIAAFGLLAEARANPDSPLSAALARSIAAAHRSHRDLVAGGLFAQLTDQVLRNALTLQGEVELAGLRIVVASEEPPSQALLGAARRARVHLLYRPFR